MTPLVEECETQLTPESLIDALRDEPGVMLLRSGLVDGVRGRYSLVTARPFLRFRSFGPHCQVRPATGEWKSQFGDPWQILQAWISRYELLDEVDLPFPLGACFGYWGFGLHRFVEPASTSRALDDLELPDCDLGFYGSLVVFDHALGKSWIIATELTADGSRSPAAARERAARWRRWLDWNPGTDSPINRARGQATLRSNLSRSQFIERVERAQRYIRAGDIYQVNLSQRFAASHAGAGWELYQRLAAISPAPFSAFQDCGPFQIISSSPELFLRMSGNRICTRPIKGTRPRSLDATEDTQLAYELQTSQKELAELVMITDLLRNDLGRVCEYGSVQVPELFRLERFAHVQHLVSTVEGQLRPRLSHLDALAACFPGGSVTGAPKIRALQIIDELEPVVRGPYTGALGYIGFNRESQVSIVIRTAVQLAGTAYFHAGAGIVADSSPEAEYFETLAKAKGFFAAVGSLALPTDGRPEPAKRQNGRTTD